MRLKDRVAVVTGSASGLGRAIATRFAEEGAKVVITDVREKPIWDQDGRSTTELIEAAGGTVSFLESDVSDPGQVAAVFDHAVEKFGRVDVAVNSAGVFNSTSILDTSEEDWDSLMAVNLRGAFLFCKQAVARMVEQEPIGEVRGRIVNVSSQHGMVGPPEFCGYGVSKAGVAQLTRQLAVDYAKKGIVVNAVAPGRIVTGTHPGEAHYLETGEPDEGLLYSLSRTPYPRLGRAEDVAGAALFLASDDCSYVSGHNLMVDGGWMAY